MERREMEQEIKLFLEECLGDGFTYQKTSECLLDFIEGCGMLPPKRDNVNYGYGEAFEKDRKLCNDYIKLAYSWEDEG